MFGDRDSLSRSVHPICVNSERWHAANSFCSMSARWNANECRSSFDVVVETHWCTVPAGPTRRYCPMCCRRSSDSISRMEKRKNAFSDTTSSGSPRRSSSKKSSSQCAMMSTTRRRICPKD
eukprot:Amastigsp_a509385_45.p7 type:complete len:121 gc:universal Amastigsp_a509385_45:1279-917(-)